MKLIYKRLLLILVCCFFFAAVTSLVYSISASTKSWTFTSSSEYTFDSDSITFSAGQAQLAETASPTWFNSSWPYRKIISIDNTANVSTLTNYQVKITLNYDSHMQADFDDIRFTDASGTAELDYWLESKTDSSTATFWVEVPSITGLSTTTIYTYYGNSGVSTASNGSNTFSFFDDFEDYSLGTFSSDATWNVFKQAGTVVEIVQDGIDKIGYYNGTTSSGAYAIGAFVPNDAATSATKHSSLPVIEIGTGFESTHVKDPYSLKVGDQNYVWYSGNNGTEWKGIGLAISDDGFNFEKSGSNPVITDDQTYDAAGVSFPTVYRDVGADASERYKMFYSCSQLSAFEYRICYAYSADGISWTKSASNPVITVGSSGAWDDYAVGITSDITKIGSTYYMFYGGRGASTDPWKVGLVTFDSFEGPFTKHASNPLISGNGTSTTTTNTTNSGVTTITVSDTSGFHENEPIYIRNGSTNELLRVESVDSATQLTVTSQTQNSYASGSTVTSWASASITPRYVDYDSSTGTWKQWTTVFQPFGTSGPLRESTANFTSTDLTTWSANYVLSPLLSFGTWDGLSAENVVINKDTQTTGHKAAFLQSDGVAADARIATVDTSFDDYVLEARVKYPRQNNVWFNFRADTYNLDNPNGYFFLKQTNNHNISQYSSGWTF